MPYLQAPLPIQGETNCMYPKVSFIWLFMTSLADTPPLPMHSMLEKKVIYFLFNEIIFVEK